MKPVDTCKAYLHYLKYATWKRAVARVRRITRNALGNRLANPWSVPVVDDDCLIGLMDYTRFNLISVKRAADEQNWNRLKTDYHVFKQQQKQVRRHPLVRHVPDEQNGRFTQLAETAFELYPDPARELIEAADRAMAGRFSLLGEPPTDLGPVPNWTERHHESDLWNHHLHAMEYLVSIGQAFHLTGDERYLQGIDTLLGHWSDQCGYPEGPAWNPHTAALRCSALVSLYCLLIPLEALSGQLHWQLVLEIVQHYLFLRRNIEYDLGYNHVISEFKALLQVRFAFPELKLFPSLEVLWEKLLDSAFEQVAADGGHEERSLFYHLAVSRDLFELLLGSEPYELPDRDDLSSLVGAMIRFAAAFTMPAGTAAPLGDGFPGYPLTAGELCALGASRYHDHEIDLMRRKTFNTLWLLGNDGQEDSHQFEDRNLFYAFPETGYWTVKTVIGKNWELLTWDCGPPGAAGNPGHAHLDSLSFHLESDQGPLCPDPGTCTYGAGTWRDYFRGTAAHNTLRVDEADQAVPWLPFRLAGRYNSRTDKIWQTPDFVLFAGSHDGYRRLPDPVDVHRTLIYLPRLLLITSDYFHARHEHAYQVAFHTPLSAGGDSEDGAAPFPGTVFSDAPIDIVLQTGDEGPPPRGWKSTGWRQREPLPSHTFSARETGPCCIVSSLWINPRESTSSMGRLEVFKRSGDTSEGPALPCREAWALCLQRPGDIRHLMLRPEIRWRTDGPLPPIIFGGVETDALFVMIRKNISSHALHFSGHQVSRITDSGLSFMEAGRPLGQVNGYIREETVRLHIDMAPGDDDDCDLTIFSPYGEKLFVNGLQVSFKREGEFLKFTHQPAISGEQT